MPPFIWSWCSLISVVALCSGFFGLGAYGTQSSWQMSGSNPCHAMDLQPFSINSTPGHGTTISSCKWHYGVIGNIVVVSIASLRDHLRVHSEVGV